MVSFVCDTCQETLKKAKLEPHTQRCRQAVFSCIDCSVTFQGTAWKAHTSCITEVQKYQKTSFQQKKLVAAVVVEEPVVVKEDAKRAGEAEKVKKVKKVKTTTTTTITEPGVVVSPIATIAESVAVIAEPVVAIVDEQVKTNKKVKKVKATASVAESPVISEKEEVVNKDEDEKMEKAASEEAEEVATEPKQKKKRSAKPRKEANIENKNQVVKEPIVKKELTSTAIYDVIKSVVQEGKCSNLRAVRKTVVKALFKQYKSSKENKVSLGKSFDEMLKASIDANGNILLSLA